MAVPAWLTATSIPHWVGRPFGPRVAIIAAALVGLSVFLAGQALLRTPELGCIADGFGHLPGTSRGGAAGITGGGRASPPPREPHLRRFPPRPHPPLARRARPA